MSLPATLASFLAAGPSSSSIAPSADGIGRFLKRLRSRYEVRADLYLGLLTPAAALVYLLRLITPL